MIFFIILIIILGLFIYFTLNYGFIFNKDQPDDQIGWTSKMKIAFYNKIRDTMRDELVNQIKDELDVEILDPNMIQDIEVALDEIAGNKIDCVINGIAKKYNPIIALNQLPKAFKNEALPAFQQEADNIRGLCEFTMNDILVIGATIIVKILSGDEEPIVDNE